MAAEEFAVSSVFILHLSFPLALGLIFILLQLACVAGVGDLWPLALFYVVLDQIQKPSASGQVRPRDKSHLFLPGSCWVKKKSEKEGVEKVSIFSSSLTNSQFWSHTQLM